MGPHDLLCKWCSTFVGKGKKFCSIFCESRYTRSKRRKLAFRRPVYSSGHRTEKEYESPRSNKTAPTKKESFLEDVITAVENEKISPERDKRRPDDNESDKSLTSPSSTKDAEKVVPSDKSVPKLDLTSPRNKKEPEKVKHITNEKDNTKDTNKELKNTKHNTTKKDERKPSATKPKELAAELRSKTHTLLVSKIPVRNKVIINDKQDLNKTEPNIRKLIDENLKTDLKTKKSSQNASEKAKDTTDLDIYNQALERHKSKTAVEYEKKVRSSGYGNPVNPRLRPMALKPRSATVSSSVSKLKRDASAKSTKSSILDSTSFSEEDSRPIVSARNSGKWELVPSTIKEESNKAGVFNGNTSLEDEDPTPKNSPRKPSKTDNGTQELAKIHEVLREESTHSDLLSQTQLQIRLSSIKKKVEVRKRGRDSRSSYGSDLDNSFQDSTTDLTSDRDALNTSIETLKMSKTSRASARSNITRISKQFQQNNP